MRAARWLLVALLVAPASARAAPPLPPEAKQRLDRGVELYQGGDYAAAVAELEAGLKIADHPDLQYALAQAQRRRGDCRSAIGTYRRFLRANPPAEEARRAEANIQRCEEALAKQGEAPAPAPPGPPAGAQGSGATPPSPPGATPPAAAPATPPPSAPVPGGELRLMGIGVAATGGLLVGLGAVFAAQAASDWSDINAAAERRDRWSKELQDTYDGAGRAETSAALFTGVGAAVVVAGGVLYYLGWRAGAAAPAATQPGPRASISVDLAQRRAGMVVTCGF